jgi:hypothetical protein
MEMSGYKLHKLIDLLIINIQGLNTTTFVDPIKEATGHAFDFMNDFKYISLKDHTTNPMLTTEVIAKAKSAFSKNNMHMYNWIKIKMNSAAVVFNIFSDLKDSTKNTLERDRNEIIMRLFVMKGIVSNQFPTVRSTIEYWPFVNACEDILTKLAEAFRAVKLWAQPALNNAIAMKEPELQKKLSHQKPFTPKPHGGGGGPPGGGKGGLPPGGGKGSGNPKGNTNPSGISKGNPTKQVTSGGGGVNPFTVNATSIGIKRDTTGNQKTSSTGATDNSAENPTPQGDLVPCKVCGGAHSAKSLAEHGTKFECPFIRKKHPHINEG